MSDTPRTDAIQHDWPSLAMHARQLDRELTAAKAEITALRSSQMTEEKAREVLEDVGWAFADGVAYLVYSPYTPIQLRAIAWYMDNMGGER